MSLLFWSGCWPGGSRIVVPGIGSGIYHPNGEVVDCEPSDCGPALLAYIRDEQEALSRRYGRQTLKVLLLKSNHLAIFGADYQLIAIADSALTLEDLIQIGAVSPSRTASSFETNLDIGV